MALTGSLLERTQQAIVHSFDHSELRQFVHIELEQNFEAITLAANLDARVFELLLWAERHDCEQDLLDKLAAARPGNAELALLAVALRTGQSLPTLRRDGPIPLQKPVRAKHFTGRDLELARLLADLQPGKAVTLCGPGGMGKTALAAEAVWRLAPGDESPERFPDGVIFHTFYHQPQAGLALEALARAYGVDPRPSAQDAARAALAGRKALLILDGAEAADDLDAVLQVAGTCGVLITTRHRGDAPDAIQDLEPLPRGEGLALLRAWAGAYAADDEAANETVRLLGGLPLALYLVGRYLAGRRQTAGVYAAWLREQGLAALSFGDRPSKSVPLLLARSLEQVSDAARAAFGAAGVLALAPFDAEILAVALDIEPGVFHRTLGELVDYGLILRPDDEYQVTHALAHSYARAEAAPDGETVGRLAQVYAELAQYASGLGLQGFAYLDGQRAHIVAVQAAALAAGQWEAVREIARAADDYLDLKGYWTERITMLQVGLAAARAASSRNDEGAFAGQLGNAYFSLGETRRAVELYEQWLVIAREIGDRYGEGASLGNLGVAYADLGEPRRAVELYEQHRVIAREIGDRRGEGNALGNLGNAYAALGETRRAVALYEQSLEIKREIGDRRGEGNALNNLGLAYAALGDPRRAVELYEQALVILREIGDRRGEAFDSWNLGAAYAGEGDLAAAANSMQVYVDYLQEIGHPDAAARAQQVAALRRRAG